MAAARHFETTVETYPIAGIFTISRGAKTAAEVVVCQISQDGRTGRGECVPYRRYGESIESVQAALLQAQSWVEQGGSRHALLDLMPAGAARNAIDCALWDLESKLAGVAVASALHIAQPKPLTTAYTISLGEPETMGAQAAQYAPRAVLKIKTGTSDDASRLRAVRANAPNSILIVDANEGWTPDNLAMHLAIAAECGVSLIEQPLPADQDDMLRDIARPVTICADESAHVTADLKGLVGKYDAINIKLDKAGGLTEALAMKAEAQVLGFQVMIGCMVGSSLAMAPAVLLAQDADYVDLDGPLLLARDCSPALTYQDSLVYPPDLALWG